MTGKDIKRIRESLQLSPERFSRLINCSHTSIYNYEAEKSKPIPAILDKLEELAKGVTR